MDIAGWTLARADEDDALPEDAKLAVLAALEGDAELDEALGGSYTRPAASAAVAEAEAPPVRAFLRSVEVSGFRGIGAGARLELVAAPGIVVVAGRNGSGKSSFAEALQVALTGGTYRGQKSAALWRENWRNLHQPAPCRIEVKLAAEGQGATTVGVDWSAADQFADAKTWVQVDGQRRQQGVAALGWGRALELYGPLLSYDELGGLLEDGPSRLHDALVAILGLEQLADAIKRLDARVKQLGEPKRRAKEAADAVRPLLESLDDSRAKAVLAEVKKRSPDLEVVRSTLAGSADHVDPAINQLAALSRISLPDHRVADSAAAELVAAADDHARSVADVADSSSASHALLAAALTFHRTHGDGTCPVCGVGTLDGQWAQQVEGRLAESSEQRSVLNAAADRLTQARTELAKLIGLRIELPAVDELPLASLGDAHAAIIRWRDAPADDQLLAAHVTAEYPNLSAAIAALATEADAAQKARQDRWAETVGPLSKWLNAADEVVRSAGVLAIADAAERWMKANLATLRNERLEPFAERTRAIWAQLRQESNVDLGSITLEGSKTRRSVELRASVDGDDAGALAVMSQGELHALALSLFIPRAMSDDSPFGFLVLDDPIQAMDPSKIDGFVQVLTELAVERQVIVFTHDDRLPDVLRTSGTPARILEVTRGNRSDISVRTSHDPAQRYLDDAHGVARDRGLEPAVKARVIPGLCRFAVEAVCRDRFYAAQLATGAMRSDVESAWEGAQGTSQRVRLIVKPTNDDLGAWIAAKPGRKEAMGICTSAVHQGLISNPLDAVDKVRAMVEDQESQVIGAAQVLLARANAAIKGEIDVPAAHSARIAAWLGRSALEDLVTSRLTDMKVMCYDASMRTKLSCLSVLDTEFARDASVLWWGLSRCCHHHAYELAPLLVEVKHYLDTLQRHAEVTQPGPGASN